ncbi:GTP pyrophosphokinase [Paenarthrobacter aromaticivorans]|uniref:RelA/SpoT domain-containing protein n=1 Tax=Paenarthrobacter aromaticivorans TaxID=2849150 RepID=A0ABS6I4H2_9MICC|nr:hypothetical protein [Paenarthrobacter sp. MMS21-TAE1-1]MBU8865596.1 hypothetical protein [Paenarthrobacter sp. MMS21-TAE1-1]
MDPQTSDNKAPYSDLSFYDDNVGLYERLKGEVVFALEQAIDIPVHSIAGRVKDRKSLFGKILRKSYDSPEREVEDIVGVRVICLYRSDLEAIEAAIRRVFDVVVREDKTVGASQGNFGYMAVHYVCTLQPTDSGPRYDRLRGLKFELQVRTILMDAWANVSHHLSYKRDEDTSGENQQAFDELAETLYLADGRFQDLAAAVAQPADSLEALDAVTVAALLEVLLPDRVDHLVPPDGIPVPTDEDVRRPLLHLVEDLLNAGYETVGQLRSDLLTYLPAALDWEKHHPGPGEGGKYFRVGIARHAVAYGNAKFVSIIYERTYGKG